MPFQMTRRKYFNVFLIVHTVSEMVEIKFQCLLSLTCHLTRNCVLRPVRAKWILENNFKNSFKILKKAYIKEWSNVGGILG